MKRVIACIDSSPCVNAVAEAAAWVAKQTQRELVLLQVLDYYPASYHLGEISGVIGFESNAMLLKELAELEQKQSELALDYSNNLLHHISDMIQQKYQIATSHLQEKGDFLEQSFQRFYFVDYKCYNASKSPYNSAQLHLLYSKVYYLFHIVS